MARWTPCGGGGEWKLDNKFAMYKCNTDLSQKPACTHNICRIGLGLGFRVRAWFYVCQCGGGPGPLFYLDLSSRE